MNCGFPGCDKSVEQHRREREWMERWTWLLAGVALVALAIVMVGRS